MPSDPAPPCRAPAKAPSILPASAATILQRGGDADDITRALLYLLDARAVTGQLICVDGGQHWLGGPDIIGD